MESVREESMVDWSAAARTTARRYSDSSDSLRRRRSRSITPVCQSQLVFSKNGGPTSFEPSARTLPRSLDQLREASTISRTKSKDSPFCRSETSEPRAMRYAY